MKLEKLQGPDQEVSQAVIRMLDLKKKKKMLDLIVDVLESRWKVLTRELK